MTFTLIKGRFMPLAGIPDGDSVRFRADNVNLWEKLEGVQPKLGKGNRVKNTVQLRFEGIDALEKGALKPLATQARDQMFQLIGFDPKENPEPAGYILTRMTDDQSGRPIAFVFAGQPQLRDGVEVFLDGALARTSVNLQLAKAGLVYPLYYNTLLDSIREEFDQAVAIAKNESRGFWPFDQTNTGVTVANYAALATIPPIWPKLWRRLEKFLRQNSSLDGFVDFLADRNERVNLLPSLEELGLQDLVEVQGNRVRLTESPEKIRVKGKAGRRGG